MAYKEIASKITGFSCPIFEISWNPPKLKIETAAKIITFLEDRREYAGKMHASIFALNNLTLVKYFSS